MSKLESLDILVLQFCEKICDFGCFFFLLFLCMITIKNSVGSRSSITYKEGAGVGDRVKKKKKKKKKRKMENM